MPCADMMIEQQMLSYGAAIGYFSGDVKGLVDDIAALKPTIFIGVPRVYDRIYAGVMDQVKKTGRPCLPQAFEDLTIHLPIKSWLCQIFRLIRRPFLGVRDTN